MHLLFLDESGRIGQDGLFALGGLAVRDTDWRELRRRWLDTLDAHGWPADREVKWHGIRTGEVPPALADAVIDALAHAIFTCYVVLLDCEAGAELPEFFATPERTYGTALMFVTERFHHLLEAEDDNSLRRFFGALIEGGTPYVQLDRIVEGLFLGPSHATGLRPEEWIALQWVDLDLANRRVTVSKVCVDGVVHWDRGKTDASFRVGLLQERALDAIRSLARPLDSSALVFPSPKGGYINLDNWRRRVWKPALASAKLEYRPLYQCRHTYATLALSAGADLYWVSKQLGHTDIRTTLRFYARFQPAVDSRNLELLDAFEDDLELEDGASDVSESGHTSNR